MKWRDYIEENPKILGGKPIFKGTRLSVELVLERLAAGETNEELLRQYPTLRPEHIRAACGFAATQLSLTRSVLFDEAI
jgi:uncharacterized protein (DUF433 family)